MLTATDSAKKLDREYKLSSSVANFGKVLYSNVMSGKIIMFIDTECMHVYMYVCMYVV